MQHILYCTDSLMAGGAEQQLVELVTRLDRQRFAPTVLCLYAGRAGRSLHFLPYLREYEVPVIILDLECNLAGKLRGVAEISRVVRRIKPDVIQAVNYHSNLLMRLARPLFPRPVKLVGCVYVKYTAKQLLYERLSSWLCDVIICNSPQLERQLRAVMASQAVEVILNGIDLERFAKEQGHLFRSRFAPNARRVLLFMGRIARQKSPQRLVEALGLMKTAGALPSDIAVWIVGEIDDEGEQAWLTAKIDEHDLDDVVVQFPATHAPETMYAAADVLVVPSLWEGLPNVVLESLAAGCPVIVSEAANAAGVIDHGANGWVFPSGDAIKLVEILRLALAESDEGLRSMRVACQQAAAGFGVEKMVKDYEALYARLSARS